MNCDCGHGTNYHDDRGCMAFLLVGRCRCSTFRVGGIPRRQQEGRNG